jgi:hypothetical protein
VPAEWEPLLWSVFARREGSCEPAPREASGDFFWSAMMLSMMD